LAFSDSCQTLAVTSVEPSRLSPGAITRLPTASGPVKIPKPVFPGSFAAKTTPPTSLMANPGDRLVPMFTERSTKLTPSLVVSR
jgi:hypothetical protein